VKTLGEATKQFNTNTELENSSYIRLRIFNSFFHIPVSNFLLDRYISEQQSVPVPTALHRWSIVMDNGWILMDGMMDNSIIGPTIALHP
jgi:hypothetical protein